MRLPYLLSSPRAVELTLVLYHYVQTTLISHLDCFSSLLSGELQVFLILLYVLSLYPHSQFQSTLHTKTLWSKSHYLFASCSQPSSYTMLSITLCASATLVFFTYSPLPQGHCLWCSPVLDYSLPS